MSDQAVLLPKWSPRSTSFWQTNSLVTLTLFELCLLWYLAQSQILLTSLNNVWSFFLRSLESSKKCVASFRRALTKFFTPIRTGGVQKNSKGSIEIHTWLICNWLCHFENMSKSGLVYTLIFIDLFRWPWSSHYQRKA